METLRTAVLLAMASVMLAVPQTLAHLAGSLPRGWRLPRETEINQPWRRASASRYLTVNGDFDGDGITDTALILVRDDGSGFAPFVALKRRDHHMEFFQAEEANAIAYLASEGLKPIRPGTYRTACGKGYGCGENEPKAITILTDAVESFRQEGPSRAIYWDRKRGQLLEVWLSD